MTSRRLLPLVVLVFLPGCQSDAKPLTPVSGTITLGGQPLANARIRFMPSGDTLGHGGSAITRDDGGYEIISNREGGRKGLLPGTYQVVLSRFVLPDGTVLPPDVPWQGSNAKESIPEMYTQRDFSPLTATVETEAKKFDFDLKK